MSYHNASSSSVQVKRSSDNVSLCLVRTDVRGVFTGQKGKNSVDTALSAQVPNFLSSLFCLILSGILFDLGQVHW